MALDTDLQTYKSEVVTDTSTNGGRLSTDLVTSGVAQNVWANVLRAERLAGSTKYRKLFNKVNDDTNDPLSGVQMYMDLPTPGDDWVIMFIGTASDTQADIVGTERKYGTAYIKNDVTAGTATVVVTVEDTTLTTGNDQIFQNGDTIRITDKVDPTSGTGNEEFKTISGAPSVSGLDITITISDTWANSYTVASASRVMSVYDYPVDLQATPDAVVVTSTAGTYDDSTYPPVLNNRSTLDTTITLTFTDSQNFTASSPQIASLPSGSITADYTPNNADWSRPYVTIELEGWGGTWVAGDTVAIPLNSASIPFWEKRVVPVNADPLANNRTVSAWNGESV